MAFTLHWHFASRDAPLDALLVDWPQGNSRPFYTALEKAGTTAAARFAAIIQLLIEETDYNPGYDIAVRDRARTAPKVARTVRRIDDRRIGLLQRLVYAPLYLQILAGPKASGFDPIVMRKPKVAATTDKPPRVPRRAARSRGGGA